MFLASGRKMRGPLSEVSLCNSGEETTFDMKTPTGASASVRHSKRLFSLLLVSFVSFQEDSLTEIGAVADLHCPLRT